MRVDNRNINGSLTAEAGTLELPSGLAGLLFLDGGTVRVSGALDAGLLTAGRGGNLSIGTGPAILDIAGDVEFDTNTTLQWDLDGTVAGTGYDQLRVTGAGRAVDLGNATLDISLDYTPAAGDSITLVDLADENSVVTGEFGGMPDNSLVTLGANGDFRISYFGGDGNDVVLTALATSELDFGDAPNSYGTTLAVDGARHLSIGPTLGSMRV